MDSSKNHQIKQGSIIGLAILSIGIAVGGIIVWKIHPKTQIEIDGWLPLKPMPWHLGGHASRNLSIEYRVLALSFNPSVSEDRDIGPPVITEIRGKAKLLYSRPDPTLRMPLGYVFDVTIKPTDLTKVPARYKRDRPAAGTNTISRLALKNARFQVNFDFILLDKDGFVLQRFESPPADIEAGRTETIQDQTGPIISAQTAAKATRIVYDMNINKDYSLLGPNE